VSGQFHDLAILSLGSQSRGSDHMPNLHLENDRLVVPCSKENFYLF